MPNMPTYKEALDTDILPPKQAAEYLGISTMTLWRWVQSGKITPIMLDHNHFQRKELDRVKGLMKKKD